MFQSSLTKHCVQDFFYFEIEIYLTSLQSVQNNKHPIHFKKL